MPPARLFGVVRSDADGGGQLVLATFTCPSQVRAAYSRQAPQTYRRCSAHQIMPKPPPLPPQYGQLSVMTGVGSFTCGEDWCNLAATSPAICVDVSCEGRSRTADLPIEAAEPSLFYCALAAPGGAVTESTAVLRWRNDDVPDRCLINSRM